MLITALLLATAAPAGSGSVDTTRAAFTKCLRDHVKKSLEAKTSASEFEVAVKSICDDERAAFRSAVIAFGRSGGDSEKVASEDADMQIDDYHANFVDKYKDYADTNTMPGD